MPNEVNDIVCFAPRHTPRGVAAPTQDRANSPRDPALGPLANLRRKISSRLARHVALERRRFVDARAIFVLGLSPRLTRWPNLLPC